MVKKYQISIALIIITILVGFLASISFKPTRKNQNTKQQTSQSKEFIETDAEIAEMEKWQSSSIDSLVTATENGDRAAIYYLGMIHLLGVGVPININAANMYFAQSASLGFGPALNKLKFMYIEDIPNSFLVMVYLNLSIASGHNELTQCYHELINQMSEQFRSTNIKQKIEQVALKKFEIILKNEDGLKNSHDKEAFVLRMPSVTDEDRYLNLDYWKRIITSEYKKEV